MPSWTSGTGSVLRLRPRHTVPLRGHNHIRLFLSSPLPGDHASPTHLPQSSKGTLPDGKQPSDNTGIPSAGPSNYSTCLDLDAFRNRLKERASSVSSAATLSLAEIGGRLNKVTGYERIEELKAKVAETEANIAVKRQASRDAKTAYEAAVARRSNSQREVNDLLQRKSSWSDADVGRFTILVREDHSYEQEEARAKAQVALTEAEVETEFNELMRTILNRYHEEQVWSDKIRSASTYGSLIALGVNIAVFFLAIIVVEPWKRRRLAQTFEKRIEELSLENREVLGRGMSNLAEHFEKQELVLAQLTGNSVRETPVDHEPSVEKGEAVAPPGLTIERMAKAARDRELWIVGAVGAVGGGVLTLLLGYIR